MNPENTGPAALETLIDQLQTLIAFLQRPVVQIQLVGVVAMIVLAAIIAAQLSSTLRRRVLDFVHGVQRLNARWHVAEGLLKRLEERLLPAITQIFFPILALAMVFLFARFLRERGIPTGILETTQSVLWFVAGYLLIITLLYALFGERIIRPYHRLLFNPLFALLVFGQVFGRFINLDQVGQISLFTLFERTVFVSTLFSALVVLYLFLVAGGLMQDILRSVVIPRIGTDIGTSNAILTITRYLVIGIGIVASLGALGFDLSTLALIGGGLSIGIGFGLQQIVSNFISGILLLFEQSLRPGDVVDVEGKLGHVERLSIRATTVRTLDNVELIIPNETFITTSVKTYTRSSRVIRTSINVSVSYNSDPVEVRRILQDVVVNHGLVLKDPEPRILFSDFGESSLDFSVHVWIEYPLQRYQIESDLRLMIWKVFKKHHIEIPFPQRDLHLRSGFEGAQGAALEAAQSAAEGTAQHELPDASERPKLPETKSEAGIQAIGTVGSADHDAVKEDVDLTSS